MVHNYSSITIANRRLERRQLNDFAATKTSLARPIMRSQRKERRLSSCAQLRARMTAIYTVTKTVDRACTLLVIASAFNSNRCVASDFPI